MLEIIGLQGAIAKGSEETFDDQPMQRGTHLRWGFAPELGFPAKIRKAGACQPSSNINVLLG
jgi:hypothetical protein